MPDQGVAVGWDRLIRHLIEEGKLVRLTELMFPAPGAYYLTWNNKRELSVAARVLRDWLREMAEPARKIAPRPEGVSQTTGLVSQVFSCSV